MNNCYVNVIGGVGNQLFQIAAGYAYAKKYDKKLIINPYNWFAKQGTNPLEYENTIFKNFEYGHLPSEGVISVAEKRFNYDEIPFYNSSVALNGYFQSLKYFEEYKDEFISLLNLPVTDIEIDIGIHIRRGDYLQSPSFHHVCHTNYFETFFEKYMGRNIKVFTDDPNHVRTEFPNYKFDIIHSNSDIEEIALMSRCNTLIGSNSSFSWWGALIGGHQSYFPAIWFADGSEASDIYHSKITQCPVY